MISSIAKTIKQFTNQLKDTSEEQTGTLTILWDDFQRENYQLTNIISLEHEYTQKDGTFSMKGKRKLAKSSEGMFFITTKIKHIYSFNLVIEQVPHEFDLLNKSQDYDLDT